MITSVSLLFTISNLLHAENYKGMFQLVYLKARVLVRERVRVFYSFIMKILFFYAMLGEFIPYETLDFLTQHNLLNIGNTTHR